MRKSRFTEAQIVSILQESSAGAKTAELLRRHGISSETFYRWKRKYGGLNISETTRLKALEAVEYGLRARHIEQRARVPCLHARR
jgi:putative transposase